MPPRFAALPPHGTLLVSTDLHGNGEDFRRLRDAFQAELARTGDAHWVILGDAVHGPSEDAAARDPRLYGYPDESPFIVREVAALRAKHPGRVHYVLGNHDFGHVGGAHTRKFHPDEVAHLEAGMTEGARAAMRVLFREALLAVVAPCGAFLAHGSPDDRLRDLGDLDRIEIPPDATTEPYLRDVLKSFIWSYGQPREVTERLLATVSRAGVRVTFVVHGHDLDENGVFFEGGNQVCPVLFGAPRANKRYLRLDLAARYAGIEDLRDGEHVVRLYPE